VVLGVSLDGIPRYTPLARNGALGDAGHDVTIYAVTLDVTAD